LGAQRSDRSFCVRPSLRSCCGNYSWGQHYARVTRIFAAPQSPTFSTISVDSGRMWHRIHAGGLPCDLVLRCARDFLAHVRARSSPLPSRFTLLQSNAAFDLGHLQSPTFDLDYGSDGGPFFVVNPRVPLTHVTSSGLILWPFARAASAMALRALLAQCAPFADRLLLGSRSLPVAVVCVTISQDKVMIV
jgi:hypothetical protein